MQIHFRNQIPHFVYLGIIMGLLLFTYSNNLKWLWSSWMENPNYSHGPLIPLISLFVIFQKKEALKNIKIDGANAGLYVLLLAAILHIMSFRAQVNFISLYSMILALIGIILFIHGKSIFSALAFPIMYLAFMIPFWGGGLNKLGNMLKILSSMLSFSIIRLLGYPILREGAILHMSNGSLEVADPCSGIRSLISLLALGTIIAYYSNGPIPRKVVLVLLGIPLALLANTLRVVFFGFVLETKGILISEGFLHTLTGLGVFGFAFLGLIASKKLLRI